MGSSSARGIVAVVVVGLLLSGCNGTDTAEPAAAPSEVTPTVTETVTETAQPAVEATPTPTPTKSRRAPRATPRKPRPRKTAAPARRTDPRFRTCTAAKAAGYGPYESGIDPEYDWYIDRDGDGTVCE